MDDGRAALQIIALWGVCRALLRLADG